MKICLITEHFPPHIGGVEIVFYEYAKRLRKKGHQVRVVTSNSGGITGPKRQQGILIDYINTISLFGHPILPRKKIAPYIKWADVVHTTTLTAALPSISLSKKYKKPCILMTHEVLANKWFQIEKNPLKALGFLLFEWYTITKKYTLWQTVSQATAKDLSKYSIASKRITTIPHGIDYHVWNKKVKKNNLHKLLKVEQSKKIFLYNGRPGQTKGIFVLLKAIKIIHDSLPKNFIFGFIISNKPRRERKKFERLIKKYKLQNIIKISDSLPYSKLPGYRKGCFAFIVPSITEGFGFTAAETSALEVPIIASDTGSIPEVVSGKVLFFKNNNPNDLAKKILLATKNKFKTIPSKKFSWDNTINAVEKIYTKLTTINENSNNN